MTTMTMHHSVRLDRTSTGRVRLTRRGRLVLFLTALALVAVALVTWVPSVTATGEAGAPVPTSTVVVEPGQTLWTIAAEVNPDGDIRSTVDAIAELNSLASAGDLTVGQRLEIPRF